jgi:hypothetical protein
MSEVIDIDAPVLIDLTGPARARRSQRRIVVSHSCGDGRAVFLGGDRVVAGGRLIVVIDTETTARYLAAVSSIAQSFELALDVYSRRPAHHGGASEPLDTASARRVARELAAVTGRAVHWDVLYGPIDGAVLAMMGAGPTSALALPHVAHDGRSCPTVRLACRLEIPVFLG